MGDPGLVSAVADSLGREVPAVTDVVREPLAYDAFLAHRAVVRVHGTVPGDDGPVAWTLVEKTTEGPGLASPYLVDNARRELAAYTSGLLADLGPGVRAPALHGSRVGPDGHTTLWLEDVRHAGVRPLDETALLRTAAHLGAMAGRWLGLAPDRAWLFTGWVDRHAQPEAVEAAARVPHLVAALPRARQVLASLPHTLCHHDAVGANVLRSGGRTVLVDWESVGPGPVGADLASLLFASVRRGDADAATITAVWDEAVRVHAAAAGVDAEVVRRGLDAAVALRWKLAADLDVAAERGEPVRRGSAPDEPPERALAELTALRDLLLAAVARTRV